MALLAQALADGIPDECLPVEVAELQGTDSPPPPQPPSAAHPPEAEPESADVEAPASPPPRPPPRRPSGITAPADLDRKSQAMERLQVRAARMYAELT